MSIASTTVELEFTSVTVNVPFVVGIQTSGVRADVYVKYGALKALAVQDVDYALAFSVDLLSFDITPLAPLLAKIAIAGPNVLFVGRDLPMTSDFDNDDAFVRQKLVYEFDRVWMGVQQAAFKLGDLQDLMVETQAAALSAAEALASEIAAAASAAAALVSEQNALASELAAAASAAAALASEVAAAASVVDAAAEVALAAVQVGLATTQVGLATTQATNASNSAIAAAASAATATTQASNASTSATTATTQAGIATTQATNAAASAVAAAASATTASTQATNAAASAVAAAASAVLAAAANISFGQCRLTKSGANLLLSRHDGAALFINGVREVIPVAGVTLAPPATTLTLYYIYAFMNAGTMTLEASTTAPATDATHGHQIKTGDATRTLVGMARTVTNAWVDTAAQRFVISYFNRRSIAGLKSLSANRTLSSASYVEVHSEIRNEFLTWADEVVIAALGGQCGCNVLGATSNSGVAFDGTTPEVPTSWAIESVANHYQQHSVTTVKGGLAVGYHYATAVVATSNGAGMLWAGTGLSAMSVVTGIRG